MTTTPPEAPEAPETPIGPEPAGQGPRVSGEELRNIAGLRRSRSDKKIAGVAGGISRHLDIDPIITRVALVVLVFFGGAGLIVYAAGWLLIPKEGESRAAVRLDDRSRSFALALVGVLAVLALLGDSLGGWGFPWPLAIIGVIVATIMYSRRGRDVPPQWVAPATDQDPHEDTAAYTSAYSSERPRRPKRRGPLLFWYALALVAIGIGILASLDLGGIYIAGSAYPALALIASAVMLLVGAFWGRPGGLIMLGLVSAVATAAATTVGELDTGQIERTPTSSSALQSDYDLDLGEITIDLRKVTDPEGLDGDTLDLEVGIGRIEVIVPDDLDVTVNSDLGAGNSTVFGNDSEGGTETAAVDGGLDAPALTINVSVGLGDIDIIREGGTR